MSLRVQRGGPLEGTTIEAAGLRHLQGVFLVEIDRDGRLIAPVGPTEQLNGGDILTFVGRVDDVLDLHRIRGLESTETRQIDQLVGGGHAFFEAVAGADLRIKPCARLAFGGASAQPPLPSTGPASALTPSSAMFDCGSGDTLLLLADRRLQRSIPRWS